MSLRNEYFKNLNLAHLENEFEQCELFLQILDTMLTFGTLLDRLDWKAIHVFKQQASSSMGHAVCTWWLLEITLLVFLNIFFDIYNTKTNWQLEGTYKFWRKKKVQKDESASTILLYIYGQHLRYFFAKPLVVFILHASSRKKHIILDRISSMQAHN